MSPRSDGILLEDSPPIETGDQQALRETLAEYGIQLPDEQVALLDAYRHELWNWNERINLTRHTKLEKFVARDVVDSLELSKLIGPGGRVLDVGTGGGVPGLILAITRPDLKVSVSESVAKKARVVEEMVQSLGLPVQVYATRAEEILEVATFDVLVARAVAPLAKFLTWLEPHWDAFDRLLLIKGRSWINERGEARHRGLLKDMKLRKVATYVTPRTDAESVILQVSPETAEDDG